MSGQAPGPDQEAARPIAAEADPPPMAEVLDDLLADFEVLEDWTERYEYIIELGRDLSDFPDAAKTDENRLHGCQSQVWLMADERGGRLYFEATSDSVIVSGLIERGHDVTVYTTGRTVPTEEESPWWYDGSITRLEGGVDSAEDVDATLTEAYGAEWSFDHVFVRSICSICWSICSAARFGLRA